MTWPLHSRVVGEASGFERMIFIFVLLVQQNAFVSIPMLMGGLSNGEMRGVENVYNTVGIALSILLIGWICLQRLRPLAFIGRTNWWAMLFTCLVLLSATWSIHPSITIRRGVGYVLTIIVAALLPLRFGVTGSLKVLSTSFAISALGSLVFVTIVPQYGIMQVQGLEGCWQGVFVTKELLGSVMAVAIFVELLILVSCPEKRWWRLCLLVAYGTLVVRSRSMTALLIASAYAAGTVVYLLWRRSGWRGLTAVTALACALLVGSSIVLPDSQSALGFIGKDVTLTGRVNLWQEVLKLVDEKPLLGWGYRAMWQPDDSTTEVVDETAGVAVPSAHNAFLEIALGLGWTGVLVMGIMICLAIRRGVRCCAKGSGLLGWFSLMFFLGVLVAGITTETLGQNQTIEWLVFNALLFSCGALDQRVEKETALRHRREKSVYREVVGIGAD
jgi:O-antigen ligase